MEKGLVGRDVTTLNAEEVKILQDSLVKKDAMNFYDWSATQNRVVFDRGNLNYWMSEYSPALSWSSRNINGFRAFSVFHDKWMANWAVSNTGVLVATIPPAMAAQYYALGVGNYHYYMNNLEE